jgi:hypothetical protein
MPTQSFDVDQNGNISGGGVRSLRGIPSIVTLGQPNAVSTPQVVPLQPVASQILSIALNNQPCTIKVYFKQIFVPVPSDIVIDPPVFSQIQPCFLDLYVNDALVIGGVLCLDRNLLVRDTYLGFIGDLAFVDTQIVTGEGSDPQISGLGTRYQLTYWQQLP